MEIVREVEKPLGFSRRVEVLVKTHLDEGPPVCDHPHDLPSLLHHPPPLVGSVGD
jgi:hypothetical protein